MRFFLLGKLPDFFHCCDNNVPYGVSGVIHSLYIGGLSRQSWIAQQQFSEKPQKIRPGCPSKQRLRFRFSATLCLPYLLFGKSKRSTYSTSTVTVTVCATAKISGRYLLSAYFSIFAAHLGKGYYEPSIGDDPIISSEES